MNPKKMFISLLPWVAFSVLLHRAGVSAAGTAAVAAAVFALVLLVRNVATGVKLIDVTGVITFALLALYAFTGPAGADAWVADYGRGAAALVLGLVMLASVLILPFTEEYARESVPQQYWGSPAFLAANRKISAAWGAILIVMSGSHFLAGMLAPLSDGPTTTGPTDLLLNWLVPAGLIFAGIKITQSVSSSAPARATVR